MISGRSYILIILLAVCLTSSLLNTEGLSQKKIRDKYIDLYNSGKYNKSLEMINNELGREYLKRVKYVTIPTDFITTNKPRSSKKNLLNLFRNRKNKISIEEENDRLFKLHLYAARNFFKIKKNNDSLNNYFQSLRFKKIEINKDDYIFYEISQVYKKENRFNAYLNALETAYSLNINKSEYSLELGKALSTTSRKKKAIYHLVHYMKLADDSVDPNLYLLLGNLYESVGKHLKTEFYYKKFLKENPDNPYITFALGYISLMRTGKLQQAFNLFDRSLKLLPENDIYRRSKAYEYRGDIAWKELEYKNAIINYSETIKYLSKVEADIKKTEDKILKLSREISEIKSELIKNREFDDYNKYEFLLDEKGKLEKSLRDVRGKLKRLNPGKIRWFIAESNERVGNLQKAIEHYRDTIRYNYKTNSSREKIVKLQLKIKRGY